jgi:hypothetical protein
VPVRVWCADGGQEALVLLVRGAGPGHGDAGSVQRRALDTSQVLQRLLGTEVDAAELDLNAKDALRTLESIQRVTINLGSTSIERTSTPSPEQASILAALKAEAAPNLRA